MINIDFINFIYVYRHSNGGALHFQMILFYIEFRIFSRQPNLCNVVQKHEYPHVYDVSILLLCSYVQCTFQNIRI